MRKLWFLIGFTFFCFSCKEKAEIKCNGSQFIENTCLDCIMLNKLLYIDSVDTQTCEYYFILRTSPEDFVFGHFIEENNAIYYNVDGNKKLLLPIDDKSNKEFEVELNNKIFKAKRDTSFYDIESSQKIHVYRYNDIYPLVNNGDITVFLSRENGILGYFISTNDSEGTERIIGIFGNIFINSYDYENMKLGLGGRHLG